MNNFNQAVPIKIQADIKILKHETDIRFPVYKPEIVANVP